LLCHIVVVALICYDFVLDAATIDQMAADLGLKTKE
jgi:hypothetical protein